jgi:raffinose/stachyose/melibiose transport system substrate-binding protein
MKVSERKQVFVLAALLVIGIGYRAFAGGGNEGKGGPLTITYGAHVANMAEQEPATYAVMEAFMKANPDIRIEISGADTDEHVKRMKMAAQAGTLPDIFWLLPAPSQEMWNAGLLFDFNEFFAQDSAAAGKIAAEMRSMSPVKDAVFGLAYQKLVTGMWYNKALFVKAGLDEPKNGTTYAEFLTMIDKLKANGVVPIAKGAKDPFSCWNFLLGWARYGYFDKIQRILAGTESFVNDDFRRYFEKIDEMRKHGAFPSNIATMDYFQAGNMFANGQAAMMDSGAWDTAKFNDALGEDVGFWWGPVYPDGIGSQKLSMQAPTNNIRVNKASMKDSAKKTAIFKFLSYFYSAEADQIRIEKGSVPLANPGDTSKVSPAFKAVLVAMADKSWPSVPDQADLIVSEPVQVAMYDAIYGVMCGTYSPEQALKNIEEAQVRER